jgi:hypothetical protein
MRRRGIGMMGGLRVVGATVILHGQWIVPGGCVACCHGDRRRAEWSALDSVGGGGCRAQALGRSARLPVVEVGVLRRAGGAPGISRCTSWQRRRLRHRCLQGFRRWRFFRLFSDGVGILSMAVAGVRIPAERCRARLKRGRRGGEKPGFKLRSSAIGSDTAVLLALILMETNFCV